MVALSVTRSILVQYQLRCGVKGCTLLVAHRCSYMIAIWVKRQKGALSRPPRFECEHYVTANNSHGLYIDPHVVTWIR